MANRGDIEKRIVKIPLPVDLIRRIDDTLAARRGGLETREQFLREAAEGLLTEISYPEAPPEPPHAVAPQPVSDATALVADARAPVPPWEQQELRLSDLTATALGPLPPGATLAERVVRPADRPLLGLHNRDYPSLWAAARLARYSESGPVPFEEYRRRVTSAAWFFGAQLRPFDRGPRELRLTALFPTNPQKPEAAEQAFQTFALGEVPRRPAASGEIVAGGPLFDWRLCQLKREDGTLSIGLTATGRRLLERLVGLSLRLPHEEAPAEAFLSHLAAHAPGDRWGFEQILLLTAGEPTREELVTAIAEEKPEWTPATASSVAQGYVARAREWGLLEPRLRQGRYGLTGFGERWQRELAHRSTAQANDGEVQ